MDEFTGNYFARNPNSVSICAQQNVYMPAATGKLKMSASVPNKSLMQVKASPSISFYHPKQLVESTSFLPPLPSVYTASATFSSSLVDPTTTRSSFSSSSVSEPSSTTNLSTTSSSSSLLIRPRHCSAEARRQYQKTQESTIFYTRPKIYKTAEEIQEEKELLAIIRQNPKTSQRSGPQECIRVEYDPKTGNRFELTVPMRRDFRRRSFIARNFFYSGTAPFVSSVGVAHAFSYYKNSRPLGGQMRISLPSKTTVYGSPFSQ
eukprot:TRINITY_DN155_c0_g1_i1.p2 TRINITY_DN155_c0_g1~~TRINITY_DN155_c0_g1_i1.p2  ORF type:complete len:262 (+),score=37.60 TRINITY_DN155_c0_g1_i1:180-965(+)